MTTDETREDGPTAAASDEDHGNESPEVDGTDHQTGRPEGIESSGVEDEHPRHHRHDV